MGVFEFVALGLMLVILGYQVYVSQKVAVVLASPFIKVLGEKEGELIVLRQTVEAARQIITQLQAQARAPEKVVELPRE